MSNLIEEKDLKQLVDKNRNENEALNCALIAAAAIWALKAGELSLVQVDDVLDERGNLKKRWVLRSAIAFNRFERFIYTEHESLVKYLNAYIDYRAAKKIGGSNIGEYRGLNSTSRLFIDPATGKGFKFIKRDRVKSKQHADGDDELSGSSVLEVPIGMNAYFKELFSNANMKKYTYKDFRQSLAIQMYRDGGRKPGVLKGIMTYLGIRSYSAIQKLLMRDTRLLKDLVSGIHKKI